MSKITSKFQARIPRALARKLGLTPGDSVEWRVSGDELRGVAAGSRDPVSREERLALFDQATQRQDARNRQRRRSAGQRGWTREELYDRGCSR